MTERTCSTAPSAAFIFQTFSSTWRYNPSNTKSSRIYGSSSTGFQPPDWRNRSSLLRTGPSAPKATEGRGVFVSGVQKESGSIAGIVSLWYSPSPCLAPGDTTRALVVHDSRTLPTRSTHCIKVYSFAEEMKPCAGSARTRNIPKAVTDRLQALLCIICFLVLLCGIFSGAKLW